MSNKSKFALVCFDVYGTILCTNDLDNQLSPRKEFIETIALIRCNYPDTKIVTVSDASLVMLNIDLQESGIDSSIFDQQFEMEKTGPKNFARVAENMGVDPHKMLVIGDNFERDIEPAIRIGATTLRVPEYEDMLDSYDLLEHIIPLLE